MIQLRNAFVKEVPCHQKSNKSFQLETPKALKSHPMQANPMEKSNGRYIYAILAIFPVNLTSPQSISSKKYKGNEPFVTYCSREKPGEWNLCMIWTEQCSFAMLCSCSTTNDLLTFALLAMVQTFFTGHLFTRISINFRISISCSQRLDDRINSLVAEVIAMRGQSSNDEM